MPILTETEPLPTPWHTRGPRALACATRAARKPHTARGPRQQADLFDAVFALDRRHARLGPLLGLLSAMCVHAAAAVAGVAHAKALGPEGPEGPMTAEIWEEYNVQLEPPTQPAQPEPAMDAPPLPATRASRNEPAKPNGPEQEPPARAAQAGALLTAEPDPDEPLDLTGNSFVTGSSMGYAGGVTAARGSSPIAVRNPKARGGGVAAAKGEMVAPPARRRSRPPRGDLSRPARPLSTNWDCGFPAQADTAQRNFARVRLVVTVGKDGRARSVAVHSDPGHGFGTLARRCAYRYAYRVGHDSRGQPATTTTPPFWVTFQR